MKIKKVIFVSLCVYNLRLVDFEVQVFSIYKMKGLSDVFRWKYFILLVYLSWQQTSLLPAGEWLWISFTILWMYVSFIFFYKNDDYDLKKHKKQQWRGIKRADMMMLLVKTLHDPLPSTVINQTMSFLFCFFEYLRINVYKCTEHKILQPNPCRENEWMCERLDGQVK